MWSYDDSKWEILSLDIVPGCSGASIHNVFENEMWVDLEFGYLNERIKFTRDNPGNAVKPSGMTIEPDGVFGQYLWHATIGSKNITFQFKGSEWFHETSDSEVIMIIDRNGNYKYIKEKNTEGRYHNGYFHFDYKSILASVLDCPTVVVIKQTENKLIIYNPFKPDVTYTLTRD